MWCKISYSEPSHISHKVKPTSRRAHQWAPVPKPTGKPTSVPPMGSSLAYTFHSLKNVVSSKIKPVEFPYKSVAVRLIATSTLAFV